MLILIAVMIFAFFVTVAFSVDVAFMHLTRSELRAATDAAAKGAAVALARTQDRTAAIRQGQSIAAENLVAGKGLQLATNDFQFGHSDQNNDGRFVFDPSGTPLNSVRVVGKRTAGSLSGSVSLFFGKIFGVNSFQPEETATATYVERDVVLVVDRSGSMTGQKFLDLQRAVGVFVSVLQANTVDEQVGLASYSSGATEDVQLTSDLRAINAGMSSMRTAGTTSISAGIQAGDRVMRSGRSREFVERTMIVMTDGLHNTGIEPRIPALTVAQSGVKIHTITFGSDADRSRMQEIATIGSGRHFHADNGLQLEQVFREIANSLSTIITE